MSAVKPVYDVIPATKERGFVVTVNGQVQGIVHQNERQARDWIVRAKRGRGFLNPESSEAILAKAGVSVKREN